jgi:hypothetical protein
MTDHGSELPGFTSIPEPDLMFAAGGLDMDWLEKMDAPDGNARSGKRY